MEELEMEGAAAAMKEPSDFLDSAVTAYTPHSSTQRFAADLPPHNHIHTTPPPPPAATSRAAIPNFCNLYRNCCRGRLLSDRPPRYIPFASHVQSFYTYALSSACSPHSGRPNPDLPSRRISLNPSSPDVYERKLNRARWAARSVGSFYNLSTFLALCSLTWATVVLLGAFVDDLRLVDYAMVTALILLEAARLASAAFFTILLTHGLARGSQDPRNIIHGKDDHYRRALKARILSSILQTILILPSFLCPIIRFRNIEYDNHHIFNSLLIFYLLIICNAIVSSITLFCSSTSFLYLRDRYDQSILRYYDELLQRAISLGVIQADDFGTFQFAYRMLGSEFERIVQPDAVVKNHRKLIEYLYRHRLGQDFLLIFLEDGDAFVQQAAVNMAGFWADPSKKVLGLEKVNIADKVLTGMADKLGLGQLGWAAVNSFGGIARRDPSILAKTRTSSGMPLLDRLAELVDVESSGSLAYVRTLVMFYHYSHEKEQEVGVLSKERELVGTLKKLLAGARVQRMRLYAAYLLHLMTHLNEACYDDVAVIRPSLDAYMFQVELELLLFIRRQCHLHAPPPDLLDLPPGFIRNDNNFGPEPDGKRFL